MKLNPKFAVFIAAAGCTVLTASAADRWWDGTTSTPDADGGAGTWNTTLTNWNDAAAAGTDVTFTALDNAVFGGTSGLVTLGETFNAGTVTFGVNGYEIATAGFNMTWAGLTGSGGSFTKSGPGTLTIGGANTSYTGTIVITGGTVSIASDGNLGSAPGSPVADQLTFNGGGLLVSATGQTLAANRGITLGAGGGKLDISALGFNGTLTVNSKITGTGPLTLAGAGDTSASGGGNSNLGIKLTNTGNDFTGDVTITAGLVAYSNSSVFGNSANKIILNGGGLIDNNSNIALSRNIEVQAGGGYIRLWNASNVTWNGALTGAGNIARTDTGTLNLSGDLSGYTGTFIQNGAAAIATKLTGAAASIGGNWTATVGTITIDSSANQSLAGTLSGTFAKSGAGTLNLTNSTVGGNWTVNTGGGLVASSASAQSMGGIISGAGTFTKSGAGTLTSTGRNTLSGLTTVSAGALRLNDARSMNGVMTVNSGATLTLENNANGGYFQPSQFDVNGAAVNSVLTSANRYHGIYTTAINLTGTSSIGTPLFISKTGIAGETLTITVASGGIAAISGTILNHPDISGGALIKAGSGTLTLTGGALASGNSTTLTGNVAVNGGILNVGYTANNSSPSATAIGNMTTVGRTVTVNSGASLAFTAADAIGQYNYKTPVTLIADGGVITRVNGSFNSIGNVTLRNGGHLTSANGQNATVNSFSLNGDVTVDGTSGSFIDTSGSSNNGIHLATGVSSSTINFNVASTGDATADLTVSAPLKDKTLGGAAGIIKAGPGKMLITGTNSYSGGTSVSGGTLVIAGTLGATAITVDSTATIDAGSNLIGKAALGAGMSIASGGHLAIHIASAPASQVTRTLTGSLTLTSGNFVDLSAATAPADGTYTLVTAASISGTPGVGTTLTLASGRVATLSVSGGTNLVLTIAPGGYDSWKNQITNGKTLRAEDADDDGFTNLQEFLFGTNPMAGTGPLTTSTTSGGVLTIRWRERVSGSSYQLLESATLANPWSLSGTAPGNDGPVDGDYQPRKAEITIGAGKNFFRIEGVEN